MALSALASYGDSDSEGSDEREEVKVRRKTEIDTKAILGVKRTKDNRGTVQISLPQFKVFNVKYTSSFKVIKVNTFMHIPKQLVYAINHPMKKFS